MCVISSCLSKTYTVSRFSYISMKIGVGRSYDGWLKIKQDWKDPFLLPLDLLRVFPAYQPQPKVRERVQKLISVILSVQASGIESRAWKMQSGSGGANRRNLVQTMRQMEKFSEITCWILVEDLGKLKQEKLLHNQVGQKKKKKRRRRGNGKGPAPLVGNWKWGEIPTLRKAHSRQGNQQGRKGP